MSIFGAIGIAQSGLTLHRTWLDAVSDNLSNMSTVTSTDEEAFRARYVIAQERAGDEGGVQVVGAAFGSAEGRLVYEPAHPLADENGYVRYPDIDMADEMAQLVMAQRGYQANAAVVDRAKETYTAALQIGRA